MKPTRGAATAALGILGILCTPLLAAAQVSQPVEQPVSRIASLAPGTIQGIVLDEKGNPLAGAMVSALGAITKFAVTDTGGRFELRTLTPGPYLVRAHLNGFLASRGQIVEVHSSGRTSSAIALRRAEAAVDGPPPVLAAGFGVVGSKESSAGSDAAASPVNATSDDHGETAWRIRHTRRGVLKDALTDVVLADDSPSPDARVFGAMTTLSRAASALFTGSPFTGQVNLLTTGSFDTPQQLFTTDSFGRGVAYLSVGAGVGEHADWTMRAAVTQGDIASWIVAGSYASRATGPHRYEFGMSYATQRYDGGNPAALRAVTDGSRNAGAVYAFDTWTLGRALAFTYGGRYSRYDYLDGRGLLSPRAVVTIAPASHLRLNARVSSRGSAPGAEEFLPPSDNDLWLPPQRTFSPFVATQSLRAERATTAAVELERDFGASTVSIGAFRQQVDNQLVTMFGIDTAGQNEAAVGHYAVGTNGNVTLSGWTASWRAAIANRLHGSVTYTLSQARWNPTEDVAYMIVFAPSAVRLQPERIHDVTASLEAAVPETATRVIVLYRVSNGFASRDVESPTVDSRFDVQLRQSLPFMNFSSAQWEMLVGVRNFFREAAVDQSVYDELLVLHPPKRIVGGLTLRF
jgi:TonB dependent receptor/Carboxypeptidase regulatory-like domain